MSLKRPRIIKFLLIVFLFVSIFFFLCFGHKTFSPVKAEESYFKEITEDTTWHKDDNLNFTKSVVINHGATLTIEKGAKISFTQKSFDFVPTLQVENGRIIAEGTADEKIVFEPASNSQFSIAFSDPKGVNPPSFFRYVQFKKLGFLNAAIGKSHSWINTALAYFDYYRYPAFLFRSGKVHMENCEFIDSFFSSIVTDFSYYGEDYEYNTPSDTYLEIVNSNFVSSGEQQAVIYNQTCQNYNEMDERIDCPRPKVLLKNNWYGNDHGPFVSNENCIYENEDEEECDPKENQESVIGEATIEGFRQNDLIADPVVVIPGILGSEKVSGNWQMDPILHTYDDLIDSLQKNGFENEKNLFVFPYDWHRSNEDTAKDLKERVEEIIADTKVSKVDMVAHSMGGLVARQYLEKMDNTKVDQLITLGTPHHGAPESYLTWENGEGFFGIKNGLLKKYLENEAKHNGHQDLKSYIHDHAISVKQLLPDYDYLVNASSGEKKSYPTDYPKNEFLEDLNKERSLNNLSLVDFTNIIGVLSDKKNTIENIKVSEDTQNGDWPHGMPENFYEDNSDHGLIYGKGDGTVPEESAEWVKSEQKIALSSSHISLPTRAQCKILEELTHKKDCQYIDKWRMPGLLYINIFSPIDIQVISPSGKKMGKDFKTGKNYSEIPDAFYSGYDTESEFLTIPNPEEGEYEILVEGVDNGAYRIEVSNITTKEEKTFSETKTFSGDTKKNQTDTLDFQLTEEGLKGAVPEDEYVQKESKEKEKDDANNKKNDSQDTLKDKNQDSNSDYLDDFLSQVEDLRRQKSIRDKKEYRYLKKYLSDIEKIDQKISSINKDKNLKSYNKNLKNKKKRLGHLLYHLGKHRSSYSRSAYNQVKNMAKNIP